MAAAGADHTVLIRSDGSAVACGHNDAGQCTIPELDEGLTYVQAAAGNCHSVLIRSDGSAVACGLNDFGQCIFPELDERLTYVIFAAGCLRVLQTAFDGASLRFSALAGDEICCIESSVADRLVDLRSQLMRRLGVRCWRADVVLPNGALLSRVLSNDPSAVLLNFV